MIAFSWDGLEEAPVLGVPHLMLPRELLLLAIIFEQIIMLEI
jgi:hypothetical protein